MISDPRRPPERTQRRQVFLSGEGIFCSAEPTTVTTTLGSCVAVCLWDANLKIGGMNHYVLPHLGTNIASPRYCDTAIDQLVAEMRRLGSRPYSTTAKIFGGAAVLPFDLQGNTVGSQNVEAGLSRLEKHGIRIVSQRTGGESGLHLRFVTDTGAVFVRPLKS